MKANKTLGQIAFEAAYGHESKSKKWWAEESGHQHALYNTIASAVEREVLKRLRKKYSLAARGMKLP